MAERIVCTLKEKLPWVRSSDSAEQVGYALLEFNTLLSLNCIPVLLPFSVMTFEREIPSLFAVPDNNAI